MTNWARVGTIGAGALALLAGSLWPHPANGQVGERLRVMVTSLVPLDGADDDFGKDLAKALRELINDFGTHQPVEEREIRRAVKQAGIKMEDLDCARSLRMIGDGFARFAFCGSYTENRLDGTFTLTGVRIAASETAFLEIPDKTWHKEDYRVAAQEVATSFGTFVRQLRQALFCGDFFEAREYEHSERSCRAALEISPDDSQVRLILAQNLRHTDRPREAYEEVLKVIESDPRNTNALQLAGFLAATLDPPRTDEARAHYDALLELSPDNALVRIRIAYELAQAGNYAEATELVEEGLEIDPDHTRLLNNHGAFAIAAGRALVVEGQPLSPAAAEYYRRGSESYRRAYGQLGSDMDAAHVHRMVVALYELDQLAPALDLTEEVLETHGEEAKLWVVKGEILMKLDRVDDALLALTEVEALEADYPNIKAMRGSWLLESGREEEAFPLLGEAVERGEQSADVIAGILFGAAVKGGIDVEDWGYAVEMIEMAKTFEPDLSEKTVAQLDFYHAFSLYSQAVSQQEPQDLQSARLTLPKFREVARLLGLARVAAYGQRNQPALFQQLGENAQQYIKIQEAVIQRGD